MICVLNTVLTAIVTFFHLHLPPSLSSNLSSCFFPFAISAFSPSSSRQSFPFLLRGHIYCTLRFLSFDPFLATLPKSYYFSLISLQLYPSFSHIFIPFVFSFYLSLSHTYYIHCSFLSLSPSFFYISLFRYIRLFSFFSLFSPIRLSHSSPMFASVSLTHV